MKKLSLAGLLLLLILSWVPIVSAQDSAPPINRVSMKQARFTALRKFPGKVKDFEFKTRSDKWVYAFKIAGKDQKMHRIIVDALTGKIISKTSEPMPAEKKVAVHPASTPKK